MNKLLVEHVSLSVKAEYYLIGKVSEYFSYITTEFEAGKVYCIDCGLGYGGWALSWALTGKYKLDQSLTKGTIKLDGKEISNSKLKELGCPVGLTGYEGTFSEKKSVRKLLTKTIAKNPRFSSIKELQDIFKLAEGRLDRGIKSYSGERWRASLALGFGAGKKVYGFPWLKPEFVGTYKDLWMKEMIGFLKSEGCIVIIPTNYHDSFSDLFDKVLRFEKPTGSIRMPPIEILDV